ncbi:uncharacterized protein LTR77_007041 [Saxophila tyrrhenica]|uniref:Uncharacterized protein n=1 Tax=Saxophila tyrrhenica TaxID=1690608 RepID=A0AAV9P7E6_9PEZI|nr:hypothetical protein LTR77_007041 [Saxophila tyrrhenica]
MSTDGEDVPEAGNDPQLRDLVVTAGKAVYWVVYPVAIGLYYVLYNLAFAVVFILKLLYRPLEFLLLPVVYLGQFLFACVLAPFKFLARFETLYIYLGIGALVGGALGLLLAFICTSLQGPLGLEPQPLESGRTAKQYRQEKRRKRENGLPLLSPGYSSPNQVSASNSSRRVGRGKGMLQQPIMEEVDSDY